ncbi:phosphotransferase [Streptomyces sp. NPDC093109]|uniref:phosphotransferase family protein n=1 Tax=Streptomyces sp. NPDC093109 TaxID=3154977 RepID=UPI0034500D55
MDGTGVDGVRSGITRDALTAVTRAAFGPGRVLTGAERLRGGSKKGVYRLTFDDAATAVLYSWDASENFWPARPAGASTEDMAADPFADATGFDLFTTAQRRLSGLGVRAPRVFLADASRTLLPAEVAVVEDLRGGSLEELLRSDRAAARPVMARLAEQLAVLQAARGPAFGKVAHVAAGGGAGQGRTCEAAVLERALRDIEEAAALDGRVAAARGPLTEAVRELAAAVQPRTEYGLIHGELGPDHVLVDPDGHPVLIDIEGLMYFDIEWEHVFLRMRFHEDYAPLSRAGLDEDRLRFYRLATHLSLVAGPLRLLEGDFPDRDFMKAIVETHLGHALDRLAPPIRARKAAESARNAMPVPKS